MRIDIRSFKQLNIIDTCSVWNLLSSDKLYNMATIVGCYFSCTRYVIYECLYKSRTVHKETDDKLRNKFSKQVDKFSSPSYSIGIDDLQSIMNLEQRKALSKGELSSIVFAQKTRQAFLTDDQKARKLSEFYIGAKNTQTIPHLFGWLSYTGKILDSDKIEIIREHENNGGQLSKFFDEVFNKAKELILSERYSSAGSV